MIGLEPQSECFRLASANTFHHGNVAIYPLAAADRAGVTGIGEIDLRRAGNYGAVSIATDRPAARHVPCATVRLDEFPAPPVPTPQLVKIDAEGMEAAVLRGLAGLRHGRLVISAEADRRPLLPELLATLQAMGCSCHAAFFLSIDLGNPRLDPSSRHCRALHVHILGFAGPSPAWLGDVRSVWTIAGIADFDRIWDKHLPSDARVGSDR